MKNPIIISVDFDECIVENDENFNIVKAKENASSIIRGWYEQGLYIIINSCRALETPNGFAMEKFLYENKIPYHQINKQSVFSREDWGPKVATKIYADLYIDDKNLEWAVAGMPDWLQINTLVQAYIYRKKQ